MTRVSDNSECHRETHFQRKLRPESLDETPVIYFSSEIAGMIRSTLEACLLGSSDHQAKRLFRCLQRDPLQLPYDNRNLLKKSISFFSTANLRSIQLWVNRINLALDIQSTKAKVGMSDIRDWLSLAKQQRGRMYFLDDDFEYDSDDSRYLSINFPD